MTAQCPQNANSVVLNTLANNFVKLSQVWAAYSPVKNSPKDAAAKAQGGNPSHSATTGELDVYQVNCRYSAALI